MIEQGVIWFVESICLLKEKYNKEKKEYFLHPKI